MKSTVAIAGLLVSGALLVPLSAWADVNEDTVNTKKVKKTYELDNGNTVEVGKAAQWDGEGNARAKRGFRVTDEDGDVIKRGVDRARKTDDGKMARSKRREWTDADGNTYQKRARGQRDGEGNARGHRQGRKIDADGNVVAKGRDRGRKYEDGSFKRKTQKRWIDANGNRHSKTRVRKRG